MRKSAGIAAVLALTGLLPAGCGKSAASLRADGDWAAFYTSSRDQSQYFYDRAGFQPGGDRIEARWKRVAPRGETTFYQLEIHCRAHVFTERGTLIVGSNGQEREVPKAERWVDHPIEVNTSTEVFARRFCPA
jgi:hypothetical protein